MTRRQPPSIKSDRVRRRRTAFSPPTPRALFSGVASIVVLMLALALAPAQSAQAEQPPPGRQDNRADYLAVLPSWVTAGTPARVVSEPSAVAATFNVTWVNDELDAGACGSINSGSGAGPDGQLSLREAICEANNSGAGPHIIDVPGGTFTLSQAAGALLVSPGGNQTITISGAGPGSTTVQATNSGCPSTTTCNNRVFNLDPNLNGNVTVTIQNMTVAHGRTSDGIGGAGIIAGCQVPGCPGFDSTTLTNVTFSDNQVLGTSPGAVGGGIQNIGGTLIVQNSTFAANSGGVFRGGGIYYDSHSPSIGTFTVSNSSFTGNTTSSNGAGIYLTAVTGSTVSITGSTFNGNQVTGSGSTGGGAGVYKDGSTAATISNSMFTSNAVQGTSTAGVDSRGGAINSNAGSLIVSLSRFFGNSVAASGNGGAIFNNNVNGTSTTAQNNWWGCSTGPNTAGCDTTAGTVNTTPWVVLSLTPTATNVCRSTSTSLTADASKNSNGVTVNPAVLNGLTVNFALVSGPAGSGVSPLSNTLSASQQTSSNFNAGTTAGPAMVSATLDNGTVQASLAIPSSFNSAASANWNVASTWNPACVPASTDAVTVLIPHTVTLPSDQSTGNVTINNGGTINTGSFNLNVGGNWTNNGGLSGTGTVTFNGNNSAQTLAGATTFNNLTINHTGTGNVSASGSTLTVNGLLRVRGGTFTSASTYNNVQIDGGATLALSGDSTVSGDLSNSGALAANAHLVSFNGAGIQNLAANTATAFANLTVNPGVILAETVPADNATVSGTLTNNGTVRKAQAITGTGLKTFGLTGVQVDVTAKGTLANLQVDRIDSNHPNATSGIQTGRYWTISATDASSTPAAGYVATLTLPHNNLPNPKACKYPGGLGGSGWDCDDGTHTTSTASTVTRTGIAGFSDWAVGSNVGPTAVSLAGFTAQPSASGTPVWLLAVLFAVGFAGWTLLRRARLMASARRGGSDRV